MDKILTREELYKLVWETPIRALATELNISDRTLAKKGDNHKIQKLGLGYWAKVLKLGVRQL